MSGSTRHRDRPRGGSDADVLNPYLYDRLAEEFGEVVVANEGEALILGAPTLDRTTGRYTPNVVWGGEYYRVPCAYCDDDMRRRLWVNHRYGTVDKDTGLVFTWLAVCFNEDCLADPDNRENFQDRLLGFRNRDARVRASEIIVRPGKVVDATLREVALPGTCTRVDRLPATHKAVRYLASRRYDVAELGPRYGVCYCSVPDPAFPQVRDRIVIPVVFNGQTVGWQARYLGADAKAAGTMKYYTMPHFPKRLTAYNWDRASQCSTIVITEGVTDSWRVGRQGVALLGRTVSQDQAQLIWAWHLAHHREGVVVLLLDGDAAEAADKAEERLAAVVTDRLVRVDLPPGRDPGSLDRDVLWGMIRAAGKAKGLKVKGPMRQP